MRRAGYMAYMREAVFKGFVWEARREETTGKK
jgi:hypothetical protein